MIPPPALNYAPAPTATMSLRVHALATATQHNVGSLLGLLLLLQQSHSAQRGVTGTHLLQELQGEKVAQISISWLCLYRQGQLQEATNTGFM